MATGTRAAHKLPDYAKSTAQRLELLGFTGWTFVEDARLGDPEKNIQVRDAVAQAPTKEVANYAAALKRGDIMPPVVFTRDGWLVDGMTRTAAARSAKWSYFPAFRLDVAYEDAPKALVDQLITLGAAFNLTHGRGLSKQNVMRVILQVSQDDDSPRDIAAKLHVSESMVARVLNADKAAKRAMRLGVEVEGLTQVTQSHLANLGARSTRYTDGPFREFVTLIRDAALSTKDATDLARRVEALGTEKEKLELLRAERESRHEVIASQAKGGSRKPARSARLRQNLGFLLANADSPGNLVELNADAADAHVKTMWDAIAVLRKVISEQDNMDRARME